MKEYEQLFDYYFDRRNKIIGLGEEALALFLKMRLYDMGIETTWRSGLKAFVDQEYEDVKTYKSNFQQVYDYLQNHDAKDLNFESLDITALVTLIEYYPMSGSNLPTGIYAITRDSKYLFKNTIQDIREIRNQMYGHKTQNLSLEEKQKLHLFELWAIGRISGLALLVMDYKASSEEWKLIYHRAKELEKELGGERWLALKDIKGKAISRNEDMSDILFMAEHGNPAAQLTAGKAYYHGDRVDRDPEKAYIWIHKAAQAGLPEAQYYLALCYSGSICIEQNPEAYRKWMKKAADQGYAEAQCEYAQEFLMHSARSLEEAKEALYWTKLAAQQDYPKAVWNLSILYEGGFGVKKDLKEAMRLKKRASDLGYSVATCYLAKRATEAKKYDEALKLYTIAKEQGADVAGELRRLERKMQENKDI